MYYDCDIKKEGNEVLREKCQKVSLPLTKDDLQCIRSLYEYVIISENEELVEQYKIRPGVGIAAPQVGVTKRMFAMNANDFLDEKKTKYCYAVINPEIIGKSDLQVYLPGGEGCLSVDRETEGLVTPRTYKILVKFVQLDLKTNKVKHVKMELEGYPAIVFQHEYDHLDGIMYVDKMFKPEELDKSILPLYTLDEDSENEENNE